ncbi:MAG TPA: ABC transporter ATP-binding protein [Solirubrobacterales bacterium]|jgi:iron(III) transport system ATP-binding protein
MSGPATLLAADLTKSFGDTPVLAGLDLEVSAGSLTAVLGPSGCGKTTLLRLLGGFEHADGGSIRLGERVLCDERTHLAPERRAIGFVPQEGALFPNLDVAANIGFGLPRAQRRGGRVAELLELVGLAGMAERFPHQLSGGQQQRVALARALAPSPAVVLLDEPFDALDAGLRAQVRAEVRAALREAGATALLVTHDQEEALSLADVVAVMREGRIVQSADPQTLYRDPVDAEVALFVGEAVLLNALLRGDHAETALGRLPIRGAPTGEQRGVVMLRPEQISCHDRPLTGSSRGRVLTTEFFGHDATARISLGAGLEITARSVGHRLPQVGDEVSIVVEGSGLAYPEGTAREEDSGQPSPLREPYLNRGSGITSNRRSVTPRLPTARRR